VTNSNSSEQPVIEAEKLSKTFGLLPVLRKLDLAIFRGQFIALMGPNGSGKSTLIRLLTGRSRATAGRIRIGGWELPEEAVRIRSQIGLVSHKSLMYESLTAYENLRFYAELYGIPSEERETRIMAMLQQVGLERRVNDQLRTFSRGMQQRLTIARALLHQPHILLMDEPYTGLDQSAAAILDELLLNARDAGHTIVMATHQLDRAVQLSDRIVILSKGKVGFDALSDDVGDAVKMASIYAETTGIASAR
jgi:heme ABC exporter ATP-binding subunit CcmA